jgi:hypothetical protein
VIGVVEVGYHLGEEDKPHAMENVTMAEIGSIRAVRFFH